MKRCIFLLFLIIYLPCNASETGSLKQDPNALNLMTAFDLSNKMASSNLNLTNKSGQAVTVYGVYLYAVAWINPGESCTDDVITGGNSNFGQYMAGTIVSPISFAEDQSVPIGQNYLYNMLYTWIYFGSFNGFGFSCALPGCSWPGDTGPYNWCFKLGSESPKALYTFSPFLANVTPFSWPTDSIFDNYAYDLNPNVNNYNWLGPFTCDDKTVTCAAATPQFQAFQP
ncbi:MAG: hypothetical protein WC627_06905 [Legionella sp.]|jgi:hypothetical protein